MRRFDCDRVRAVSLSSQLIAPTTMDPTFSEWLKLILRWTHIFAGILWVGTTYFFTWLDGRFSELEEKAKTEKTEGGVWMVHSGGFYLIEKQKRPQLMPQVLHWFKWESAITWLSGILLLGLVYYHGALMVELEDARISNVTAMWISLGLMLAGWVVYDFLWRSPLCKNEYVGIAISFAIIVALAWWLSKYFAGRAAYMQLGAMLGTIMTANVWMRILPPQRRMVAALKAGKEPDLAEGARAKTRSKHNTFIVQPVVFLMLSNHFPTITYGHKYNWVVLSGIVLAGWLVAKILRRA